MTQHCWSGADLAAPTGDSVVALALSAAAQFPDRPALIDAADGAVIRYRDLGDGLLRVAAAAVGGGLRQGEVVAILAPNSAAWVTYALGVMAAGGIVTGINPLLKPEEIGRQLKVSGARRLAVAARLLPLVDGAGIDRLVDEVLVLDGAPGGRRSLADLQREGRPDTAAIRSGPLALLPFSSGTSGLPKGVMVPARSLVLQAAAIVRLLGLTSGDVLMAATPFFHVVALSGVLAPALSLALPVVIVPVPELAALLVAVARHRVTFTVVTPPVVRALAEDPAVAHHDLSSLRRLACTAAPLSAAVQTAAARRLGIPVFQAYGMTESVGAITFGPVDAPRPGSCGRAAPGCTVRIVDPVTGDSLPAGSPGEVQVRSAMVMQGYLNDPAATADTLTGDGWLRSGDLGYIDADGHLFIVDRLKELIKVGSAQVAPAELEAVLAGHPGVADAVVVGRPSAATGEVPVAYVVAREPLDEAALIAWVAERVAPFKRLQAVTFVAAVPRQPNGKVLRRLLREREANPV